jgi:antirestriction protein ArdC
MQTNTVPIQENRSTRQDVQQLVTDTIIQQLEKGVIPWQQPWKGDNSLMAGLPYNTVSGNKYRGINIVLLWSAGLKHNYQTNEWATFNQWKATNELVKKGEKGNLIVFYDAIEKEKDGEIQKIPFLKSYYVFNKSQLQSWKPMEPTEYAKPSVNQAIEKSVPLDNFIAETKAIIEAHDGGACYRPVDDKILIPYPEKFIDTPTCSAFEGYYSTLLHELTHWSGAKHRLDRTKGKKFGDHQYAVEELVAEFGAAFMCAEFGISTLDKGDHAGYIDNWLKVLKENKQVLSAAAGEASKAVDYLYSLNR